MTLKIFDSRFLNFLYWSNCQPHLEFCHRVYSKTLLLYTRNVFLGISKPSIYGFIQNYMSVLLWVNSKLHVCIIMGLFKIICWVYISIISHLLTTQSKFHLFFDPIFANETSKEMNVAYNRHVESLVRCTICGR